MRSLSISLLATLLTMTSCSDGGFNDERDHYLSKYGFQLRPGGAGASVVGLVQDELGQPVSNVEVYARGSSFVALTNHRGAFRLPQLPPGSYQLLVLNRGVSGATLEIEIQEPKTYELETIVLERLIAVSGTVKVSKAVRGQIIVGIDGTPLQTMSNSDGSYFLQVPKGEHRLSAKHALYQTFLTEPTFFDSDRKVNIELQPYAYPTATIVVDSPDKYVVTGSEVTLKFDVPAGVSHFRLVEDFSELVGLESSKADWHEIPEGDYKLKVRREGLYSLSFQVADIFGKVSNLIRVSFYYHNRDSTWKILHGTVKGDLVVDQGSRILFVPFPQPDGVTLSNPRGLKRPDLFNNEPRMVLSPGRPRSAQAFASTRVKGNLLALAGSTIEGGVTVDGSIEVRGESSAGVSWYGSSWGDVFSDHIKASFLSAKNLSIGASTTVVGDTTFLCDHCRFDSASIVAPSALDVHEEQESSKVQITHTQLFGSTISLTCLGPALGEETGTGLSPGERTPVPTRYIDIEVTDSDFEASSFGFGCGWQSGEPVPDVDASAFVPEKAKLTLKRNNFWKAKPLGAYFEFDYLVGLPEPIVLKYDVEKNYFHEEHKLFRGMKSKEEWPKFFPRSLQDPNER